MKNIKNKSQIIIFLLAGFGSLAVVKRAEICLFNKIYSEALGFDPGGL
tara:strand:+ start:621 stop:764 length:144 start_codon:yes stop_codon:yes gene_type:complete